MVQVFFRLFREVLSVQSRKSGKLGMTVAGPSLTTKPYFIVGSYDKA